MPDPLPSVTSSNLSASTAGSASRNTLRSSLSLDANTQLMSSSEETPQRSSLWPGGALSRLNAPRYAYNLKDDMEVFSPLDMPITLSIDKIWNDMDGATKDPTSADKSPASLLFPSSRRFQFSDSMSSHPIVDWKSSSASKQVILTFTVANVTRYSLRKIGKSR